MKDPRALLIAAAIASLASVAVGQEKSPREFQRIDKRTAEELVRVLEGVPEIGFDPQTARTLYKSLASGWKSGALAPDTGPKLYHKQVLNRPQLAIVPWRAAPNCQLTTAEASHLGSYSVELRRSAIRAVEKGAARPTISKLEELLTEKPASDWTSAGCVSTILQMIQGEQPPVRELLVKFLTKIDGKEASLALAQRALFDVSPEIREQAVVALSKRPAAEYQDALVAGFRWPIGAVAEHAAEAIVHLDLQSAVKEMTAIYTEERDPRLPFTSAKEKAVQVREVVKLNHLTNCMLCHAPATSTSDPVRGRVPIPGEAIPETYYEDPSGIFVRADVTYLRQDFSIVHRVAGAGKWPEHQRHDFLLRMRTPTAKEVEQLEVSAKSAAIEGASRRALQFALVQLRGELPSRNSASRSKKLIVQK